MPTVSTIIPTYNRAHLLGRAIRSVQAQSFQDWELLVVDDASTDNTKEMVRSLSDSRIVYLAHPENRGPSAARNSGIHAASGRYVGFLDSDDEWLPQKLERQVVLLDQNAETGLVYGGWEWFSDITERVVLRRVPDGRGRIDGLPRWAFNIAVDFLVRRAALQECPYDERLRSYMEYDLLLRLAMKYSMSYVPEVLVLCHAHSGPRNNQRDLRSKVAVLEYLLNTYGPLIHSDPRAWARFNLILGALYLRSLHQPHRARRHLWRVVAARPLYWKGWAYALGSLAPSRLWTRGGTGSGE